MAQKSGVKLVAKNPKAYHEYYIVEKFEAGVELFGTEVKSIRAGKLSLKEAWCDIKNGEVFVKQMHISPYEQGSFSNRDPLRPKRLLLHKKEIQMLEAKVSQAGYALAGVGVELDAIASVVIGGTLLSGGVGTVLGTLFGVAIQGLIQTYINFDGTLSSWWTKIAIGILLFIFIALQRGLTVLWENRQSSPVTRVNIAQR